MAGRVGKPCPRFNEATQRVCGGPLICVDEYGDVSCLWCGYVQGQPLKQSLFNRDALLKAAKGVSDARLEEQMKEMLT